MPTARPGHGEARSDAASTAASGAIPAHILCSADQTSVCDRLGQHSADLGFCARCGPAKAPENELTEGLADWETARGPIWFRAMQHDVLGWRQLALSRSSPALHPPLAADLPCDE